MFFEPQSHRDTKLHREPQWASLSLCLRGSTLPNSEQSAQECDPPKAGQAQVKLNR